MRFAPETVKANPIRAENEFGGIRVTLTAFLENARIPFQVDIGFGDATVPEPQAVGFPTLLPDFAAPHLLAYQKETTIAEKLHALVLLERGNSRMKDFLGVDVGDGFTGRKRQFLSFVNAVQGIEIARQCERLFDLLTVVVFENKADAGHESSPEPKGRAFLSAYLIPEIATGGKIFGCVSSELTGKRDRRVVSGVPVLKSAPLTCSARCLFR